MENNKPTGLALLRVPFEKHQISKLPKPYKKDSPKGNCSECGGYHGLPAVHLNYVGHAAATDRLLEADPSWTWEPVAFDKETGLPKLDKNNGLWIKMTVCGVTRYGYGSAEGEFDGDFVKELIGDAIRNAGMRFGMALDLWHKGDLHKEKKEEQKAKTQSQPLDIDPFEYVINLGDKNKLSKTKIKENDINFLVTERDRLLDYYKKENKQPHKNVIEFSAMLDTALRLTAEKIKI